MNLSIDVRLGHMVEVDQRQRRDTASRQRLRGPGTDAADADDRDAGTRQPGVAGVAIEPPQAAEAALQVGYALLGPSGPRLHECAYFSPPIRCFAAAAASLDGWVLISSSSVRRAALYWLGNAQYGKRDYKDAIVSFRALVAGTPDHPRVPEALLSIANCQIELKDNKAARRTLEELIKTHPSSEAAAAAKQRIGGLK